MFPDYIWIWNCRCQYPSDSSDWPSPWTASKQNWPFLCVLFTFRHCGAFTGEGEIATTATRWHTQAEGNGLCSSLILKITFWKGGRRHNDLLQPRGFVLTERRDFHVLTEVKLNEKKKTVIVHFIAPQNAHGALPSTLHHAVWWTNRNTSLQSSGRNKWVDRFLWMFIPPPARALQAALGPERAAFSAKSKARAAGRGVRVSF